MPVTHPTGPVTHPTGPVTHPTGPVTHPTGGGNLIFICIAGAACCAVGVIFLYKAVTCTEFRETDEGERKTRASLLWPGRMMSGFLGLLGIGAGILIIVRVLKG
jgi:hypothetical protein